MLQTFCHNFNLELKPYFRIFEKMTDEDNIPRAEKKAWDHISWKTDNLIPPDIRGPVDGDGPQTGPGSFRREEIYRKGFMRLDLVTSPSSAQHKTTRIIIENPAESPIQEIVISCEPDVIVRSSIPSKEFIFESTNVYEILLVPYQKEALRPIFDRLEAAGANLWSPNSAYYDEHNDMERVLKNSFHLQGCIFLHSISTKNLVNLSPKLDIWRCKIDALYDSRLIGRDEVNDAIKETIEEGLKMAENGFFIQEDQAIQRRMMNNIGIKLNRIYDMMYPSERER